MDNYIESEIVEEANVDITPNIKYQINKFGCNEFTNKIIPQDYFFISSKLKQKLLSIYQANCDIPLLIHGQKGIGKLTAIIGLLREIPQFSADVEDDGDRINNITYMKILNKEYEKLFSYENVYYVNLEILNNNTEIITYLRYIYKLARSRSIDGLKKIFIIKHIEVCNDEQTRYIKYMLDRLTDIVSYIFITTRLNNISQNIKSSCLAIHFDHLDLSEFTMVFKKNFKSYLEPKYMIPSYMKQYYSIYKHNEYNIGRTLSQIKFILANNEIINLEKLSDENNSLPLLDRIVKNFIKNKLKLTNIDLTLEIRKVLYTLVSLNMDLLEFARKLVRQLLIAKLNNKIKALIITKAGELSHILVYINKPVLAMEQFIVSLIRIIYSSGKE
jgi:hypothetical protein